MILETVMKKSFVQFQSNIDVYSVENIVKRNLHVQMLTTYFEMTLIRLEESKVTVIY